jgi:octopine/nopaline transport system substrate-binding protein
MKRRSLLLAFPALGLTSAGLRAQARRKIKLGTDGNYSPFNFAGPAGGLLGFEPDLADEACRRLGLDHEWIVQSFDGLIPGLQDGRFDTILASLSITPARAKSVDFSLPYYAGYTQIIVASEHPLGRFADGRGQIIVLDQLSDDNKTTLAKMSEVLADSTVGVSRGSTHAKFAAEFLPSLKIRIYEKSEAGLLDLAAGRVDAVIDGMGTNTKFMREQEKAGRKFIPFGPGMRGGPLGKGVALAFRKGDQIDLREAFNKVIREMTADGTIGRLSLKWLGFDGSLEENKI